MSLTRSVGRNTIIQFVGKIIGTVLGLITTAYLQRYLQPTGYGAYISAMAYLGIFSVVADLGLYLIMIRDLNKPGADEQKIVGNLLALRWVSALVILAGGAAIVFTIPYTSVERGAVLVGSISFLAVAATQVMIGIFQTKLAMGYVAGAELAGRVILLGLTILAVRLAGSLNAFMWAVVGGSVVNFVLVWLAARRFVKFTLRFDWPYWMDTLRQTAPIAISIVLNLIYFRADTIILRLIHGEYAAGLYGSAYKILEIVNTFPLMFVGLILPALGSAFARTDRETFQRIFQRGFDLLMMAMMPMLVGGWILAKSALVAIGNDAYGPAGPVLRLLLIAVAALFLASLSGHAVTIINRQRQMVWGYLSVAIVGLVVYLTLIPRYGLYGAAIGTIITETLTAIIGFVLVLKVMQFRLRFKALPKLLLSGAIMGAVVWLMRDLNFWLVAIIGGAVYLIAIIMTKALPVSVIREIIASRSAPTEPLSTP